MRSYIVFRPRTANETLIEYLEQSARCGHRVHFPGAGPGVLETSDPTLHIRAFPDKIRLHLIKHEWDAQLRFYCVGDLELPSSLLSVCGDLGIGISVWRSNVELG